MLVGVDRVLLRVGSLEGAVSYYRDVLGMKLLRCERGLRGGVAAFELAGGVELVLHDSADLPAQGVYFRVDSVDAVYDRREELRLKFTGSPRGVSKGKAGTVKDPFGNVLLLLDRTKDTRSNAAGEAAGEAAAEAAGGAAVAPAPAAGALFAGVELRQSIKRDKLIAAYARVGRTADDLPYTHHFEALYAEYTAAFAEPSAATGVGGGKAAGGRVEPVLTREEVWRHLLTTRKAGKLPKLGEARSEAPELSDEEKITLRRLLEEIGGGTGRRDRLPYSREFDAVVERFNREVRKALTPHQVWRAVASLAK